MARLATTAATTPHSGIREMAALARAVPDVLNLGVGDPNFITPQHIIDAAAAAATRGATKYTASDGNARLRELISEKVGIRNGIEAAPEQVVVTTGGCGGLFTSLLVLLDPGDEVLVPDPGWANYPAMVHVLAASSVPYPLDPARGWEPDIGALAERITSRSKVLVLNSPGNPTGSVIGRAALERILDLARRHDLWVISDECYDELVFDGDSVSSASLGEPDRVLTVFSFSKSYAMTGWRIGYVVAPAAVAVALGKAQEPVVANASSLSQAGAEAALSGPQECVHTMRDAYRDRRDAVVALLDELDIGYVRPAGAFYLMVDVRRAGDSREFALGLLRDEQVSVVPGRAFGAGGEGWVRMSLCVDPGDLMEAARRLGAALARYAASSR